VGVLLAASPLLAASNGPGPRNSPTAPATATTNDPVEKEYLKLLDDDDAAQAEVDEWIKQDDKFREQGAGLADVTLRPRIKQRFDPIRKAYEDFLQRHPDHARARLAYGSFLNDLGEEEAAAQHWEKARVLDPSNPAVWNNLGTYYGHGGTAKKAFEYYGKAIALSPKESVYYQNLATTVYLFRKDAQEFYEISEPLVFNKALALYRKALALDPKNFPLATELAQTYYGFKPPVSEDVETMLREEKKHYDEALAAWRVALGLAHDGIEREGIYIHLARLNLMAGRWDEARRHLTLVTNGMYNAVRERLEKKLANQENKALSVPPPSLR
jgi:tetratricopeptide (TPR) repeat protein